MADMTEVDRLKAENLKLRKILAHVPAGIALKAKEDAGFGEPIRLQGSENGQGKAEENTQA